MKIRIPLLITLFACISSLSAQLNVSVYRNDGKFNNYRLSEGDSVRHAVSGGIPEMVFNDFASGKTRMPLSAVDSLVIHSTDIPVLRFTLPDYPEATMLWEKALYLDARLTIEGNGYTDDEEDLSLQIKGRGNSTWLLDKKPIRLKFKKKTSICGFKKAKSYVLLANYIDPTLMRNTMAMWLARKLDVPYANTIVPCNVFINGAYAGAYMLTEKVGINSGSVDIDEEKGMLFEISQEYDEKYKFRSPHWNCPVMVKDPDFDELYEDNPEGLSPEERLAVWEEDFNFAEQKIAEGKADEVLDMESVANYMMVQYFMLNPDICMLKSFYLHKYSLEDGEKYHFGPAWDFDCTCNICEMVDGAIYTSSPEGALWLPPILCALVETETFRNIFSERLKYLEEIMPEFFEYFDNYARMIEPSAKLNGMRWPESWQIPDWIYVENSFDTKRHVKELRDWFERRAEYITEKDEIMYWANPN